MSKVYEVVGPLAVIKASDGKLRYYYTGAQVPADLPATELERLAALGLLTEVDVPAAGVLGPERPSPSAGKAAWVAYAESRGMDHDDAAKLTRDQLVERFPADDES
jgi:hypothetical protein